MNVTFSSVTLDCADAQALASFWNAVLGWEIAYSADDGAYLANPSGPGLFLQPVPEPKRAKNRAHLDLTSADYPRDLAAAREAGATVVAERDAPDGRPYAVLADPEGNEFCLLSPRG